MLPIIKTPEVLNVHNINQYFSKLNNERLQERHGRAGTGGVFSWGCEVSWQRFVGSGPH